ncbi:hypothetical protein PF007_g2443 [Phytophthora fragariae]|uniref:Cysteine-rich protein n=1 Tax=Phytophthora fragariae TaxID=53985 RepID=A0A6A3TG43_9STRA|nr:hypothetical protein PF007_g2443 [Phytophthora fragariae]
MQLHPASILVHDSWILKLPRHPKLPTTCTTKTTVVKNGPESRPSSKPVSVSKCHRFKMLKKIAAALVVLGLTASPEANAGLLAYGICQTGCNALAVACYTAAGAVFGTVTVGVGTLPAVIGCNVALGTCMASCVAAGLAPTP